MQFSTMDSSKEERDRDWSGATSPHDNMLQKRTGIYF